MAKKGSIVKNQHYIPESLLRHFANPDGGFFETLFSQKKVYPSTPRKSMCEKFTYEDENLEVNTVEDFFARMEGDVAKLMRGLIEIINSHKEGKKDFSEIKRVVEHLLPIFIVFYYRSGALLKEFSSLNKKHKIPALTKKIMNRDYIRALANMIKTYYRFSIIESSDDFLMSDQYVSTAALDIKARFDVISNRHMGLQETIVLIPITSSYYAVYWNTDKSFFLQPNEINELEEKNIKLINRTIANNSYIKAIAPRKSRLEQVLDEYKLAFPSQIFAGGNPPGYFIGAIKKKEVFLHQEDGEAFELVKFDPSLSRYKDLGRNDLCACESGKKFKKCHGDIYKKARMAANTFGDQGIDHIIQGVEVIELPVDSWSGFAKK